jgi:hypothetical protein
LRIRERPGFGAEKFHTSEELLTLLNPAKTVDRAGTVITVPNVADGRPGGQVFRIEVDKPAGTVRAFGRNDELIYILRWPDCQRPHPSLRSEVPVQRRANR